VKSDEEVVDGGLDIRNPDVSHIYALMRVLHTHVVEAKSARSVDVLMKFFYSNLSQTLAKIDGSRFSCRAGCDFCCRSWVAASAPEVLYLLKNISEDRQDETRNDISTAFAATRGIGSKQRQRMNTPCPMLSARKCSQYEFRPLVCRTLVSFDANACERIYTKFSGERIPRSDGYNVLRNVYALALAGALRREGLSAFFYEFNSALSKVISSEHPEEKWLAGENILEGIPKDSGGDMFSDSWNEDVYQQVFARH
jgi:Fe-S-cluster containining protein